MPGFQPGGGRSVAGETEAGKEAPMPEEKPSGSALESPEERFEHDIEELESPSWRKNKTQLVALMILVVVAAALIFWMAQREKPKITQAGPAVTQIDVIEPRPGKLSNTPTKFRWEALSGTKYYAFSLSGKGAPSPLVRRSPSNPTVTLTPDEQNRLVKGSSYTWMIESFSDTGKILGRGEGAFDL